MDSAAYLFGVKNTLAPVKVAPPPIRQPEFSHAGAKALVKKISKKEEGEFSKKMKKVKAFEKEQRAKDEGYPVSEDEPKRARKKKED